MLEVVVLESLPLFCLDDLGVPLLLLLVIVIVIIIVIIIVSCVLLVLRLLLLRDRLRLLVGLMSWLSSYSQRRRRRGETANCTHGGCGCSLGRFLPHHRRLRFQQRLFAVSRSPLCAGVHLGRGRVRACSEVGARTDGWPG
jgi:hypothetical protein